MKAWRRACATVAGAKVAGSSGVKNKSGYLSMGMILSVRLCVSLCDITYGVPT